MNDPSGQVVVVDNSAILTETMSYYGAPTTSSYPIDDQAYHMEKAAMSNAVWKNFLWRSHSNHCVPIQNSFPEKVDLLTFQLLFSLLYALVWFAAIAGNLCVIYVVTLKQVSLSSVRSVFICSLAVSDILMSLTSLPITAVSIFTRDWVFPSIFCKLIGVVQGGSVFVSSFTMTAIAVDRFLLIRNPTGNKLSFEAAMLSVIIIWALGYTFALPVGIFSDVSSYPPLCGVFCDEAWPDTNETGVSQLRKLYGLFVLVVQFGLPLILSSLCYWTIGRIINRQIQKRHKQQILLQDNQNRLEDRKHRSHRMMIAMVGGLVLAWLPMNLINLWRDFGTSDSSSWYTLIFAACHVIAMTSAAWNCAIYNWFNPQFKETLLEALGKDSHVPLLLNSVLQKRGSMPSNVSTFVNHTQRGSKPNF